MDGATGGMADAGALVSVTSPRGIPRRRPRSRLDTSASARKDPSGVRTRVACAGSSARPPAERGGGRARAGAGAAARRRRPG